jgi:hypothetical protein
MIHARNPDIGGVVIIFFLALGLGIFLSRQTENPIARGIGRILLGGLAVAGVAAVVVVLWALAMIIAILSTCSRGCR